MSSQPDLHWSERIEPMGQNTVDGPQIAALVSIAISLKRIADALEMGRAALSPHAPPTLDNQEQGDRT